MRTSRMKVRGRGCYYHLMNRITGHRNNYPFTDVDKEKGFKVIEDLRRYYLLELISMTWMGNHFHIVLYAPSSECLPSEKDILERHNRYYASRGICIDPEDIDNIRQAGENMIDISHFMRLFQQKFTYHINKTHKLRGTLWADRFKSTILEANESLWSCVKYVVLNPIRAKIAKDPASYRFSSWGRYCGTGKHPFHDDFIKHMRGWLGEIAKDWTEDQLLAQFRSELARTMANEAGKSRSEVRKATQKARRKESMPIRFLRRTRHWSDGAIIGSKAFIQETAVLFEENKERIMKKQLSQGKTSSGAVLHCFRRLRQIPS